MSQQDKKIDLATAEQWTENWRENESDFNKHNECNGFLIPAEDLEGTLDEMKSQAGQKYVRAYIGVDTSITPNTEKLIIVGTKPETQKDGSVVYRDLISGYQLADGSSGGSIYDFTTPIPPGGDPDSPLN